MDSAEKETWKAIQAGACLLCCSKTIYTRFGIALGMDGFDYSFCVDCLDKKTVRELIIKVQRYSDNWEEINA